MQTKAMHRVTDVQVDFILNDIRKRGIETEDVRDNILDHVCCIIENEMPEGKDFYGFYEDTIAQFYRKELAEIEQETRDLITFKYYYAMKRTLKITGFTSILLILIGSVLKFQHLPGAAVCLFSGLILFSLIFLPLNIILKFRDDKEKSSRLVMTLGLLLGITGSLGVIFKVMHWPWANVLFYGSFLAFFALFIPVFFVIRYRQPDKRFNAIVQTTFMVAACGMLFALVNLGPSRNIAASVESLDTFQESNLKQMEQTNATIYAKVGMQTSEEVTQFRQVSADLSGKITAIKAQLIALSNEVSLEKAKELSIRDLKRPDDFHVVEHHFEKGDSETSYAGFKLAIAAYNNYLVENKELIDENIAHSIDVGELQMTKTALSVVLHELIDIQMQVLMNERALLNYHRGKLAMK
jgi:hypothetical protein